ncbi:MAG: NSS family neurotransmitter:Na+ symporter [Reinekea sp.]
MRHNRSIISVLCQYSSLGQDFFNCVVKVYAKMNPFLLITLLIGTQIGLSDGLVLPVLAAKHGQGSFLIVYAFTKLIFILPILQAELVAGRIYRASPFELSFLALNKRLAAVLLSLLVMALIFVLASNLFNTAWTMIYSIDGVSGKLLGLRPLDQNLYWFEQSQNTNRIMSFVIAQGIFLMLLGGLAWRGIISVFQFFVPICAVFILISLPKIAELMTVLQYPALSWNDIFVAIQHSITSSLAGLLIWYVIGTKVSDQLPTGRAIIAVQLFDVLFGLALLSISYQWLDALSADYLEVGTVFRLLMASLSNVEAVPMYTMLWLIVLPVVGVLSSVPLLLLLTQQLGSIIRHWLLALTTLAVVILSGALVLSNGVYSPIVWYGRPLYDVVQALGQGLIIPLITGGVSFWVGWVMVPNQVLRQINPHGGIRYFLWRLVLRFVVPVLLGVIFARTTLTLTSFTPTQVLVFCLLAIVGVRLFTWVKKRAIFPSYD